MDYEFKNNFLIICRYLDLVQKSEDNIIGNIKFISYYNIKVLDRLREKIYVIFIERYPSERIYWAEVTHVKHLILDL